MTVSGTGGEDQGGARRKREERSEVWPRRKVKEKSQNIDVAERERGKGKERET